MSPGTWNGNAKEWDRTLITLWNLVPLKCNGFPLGPTPFSPVQRHLKFSAVLGTTSANN